ncbi:MAG: glycosyltransferase family 4 protein [Candidatus Nomurabacteria bacterium]|nr:glycosyltransferase family 4 protein [Candidatus Nomurabacteria bacterium]
MNNSKINIQYPMHVGPWGGGNQFLKALKVALQNMNVYEESPEKSDIVLFNSFDSLGNITAIKKNNPDILFVHRVDGPISLIRGHGKIYDKKIFSINHAVADGTIFQSEWSKNKLQEMGMPRNKFETVIHNAVDTAVFFPKDTPNKNKKIKLVAVSWSNNINKGFDDYEYLDKHLDFDKYEMTFVGRSPVIFSNIKMIDPVSSDELAGMLRSHDIYITASKHDPCSNSLIEAMACGLPAVAYNDGGHTELVGNNGELFSHQSELIEKINLVALDMGKYKKGVNEQESIDAVAKKYYNFMSGIYRANQNKNYTAKKLARLYWLRQISFWFLEQLFRVRLKLSNK